MAFMTKTNSIGLLLFILFAALAISILCPFYKEGLTSAEVDSSGPIRTALLTYTNQVESNCQKMINGIGSIAGLSQTESVSINPIIGNTNFTNTAKFQQIVALNSKNKYLIETLNTVQGQNFTALLNLLQTLPTNTSDTTFNDKVTKQITAINKIMNSADMQSPYYTINTYVQNTSPTS